MRSFRVPNNANENKVKAEFKDGTINNMLFKSEAIQVGKGQEQGDQCSGVVKNLRGGRQQNPRCSRRGTATVPAQTIMREGVMILRFKDE